MTTKTFDRDFLLNCATEVLKWISLQDPMYAERIDITRVEYKLDDLQILASYCARVLDIGEHMYYCEREFMQPNYAGHLGVRTCMVCDHEFQPSRPSDEICSSKECAEAYFAAMDKKFEASKK